MSKVTTTNSDIRPASRAVAVSRPRVAAASTGLRGALIESTKPRIVRLVVITASVGLGLSALSHGFKDSGVPPLPGSSLGWTDPSGLGLVRLILITMIGTALSAAGANSINQWMERHRDALMPRTKRRPLPTGRAEPMQVLVFGVFLSVLGVMTLLLLSTPLPALLSATCVLVYVLLYTPLKPVTPWATLIGTIPGALPPLIGWTAAGGGAGGAGGASDAHGLSALWESGGLSLFLLMTAWQMPHFMAIGWMYKDDYAMGGYKILPVVDETGRRTARSIALWTLALFALSLLPAWMMPRWVGLPYVVVASAAGGVFVALALRLIRERTRENARAVFFASIAHLPLILLAMVGEALVRAILR